VMGLLSSRAGGPCLTRMISTSFTAAARYGPWRSCIYRKYFGQKARQG
jgi:hypothetical protein